MNVEQTVDGLLRQAGLPDYVDSWILVEDIDSTGDPAVYIWIILKDEEAEGPDFLRHASELRERV